MSYFVSQSRNNSSIGAVNGVWDATLNTVRSLADYFQPAVPTWRLTYDQRHAVFLFNSSPY